MDAKEKAILQGEALEILEDAFIEKKFDIVDPTIRKHIRNIIADILHQRDDANSQLKEAREIIDNLLIILKSEHHTAHYFQGEIKNSEDFLNQHKE